jgi:sugar O-acyltransferase (sialic acid O-acetyltransferase NeuD family)
MKNLLIVGAGGCGRETYQWAQDINRRCPTWTVKGFLDDDLNALHDKQCDINVLSKIDDYIPCPEDELICAIGNCGMKKKITEKLVAKGAKFASIIHPTAIVADTAKLGNGIILYPYTVISDNAHIDTGVIINMHSSVGHDAKLGKYCTISSYCDITGKCVLGNEVFLGSSVKMIPSTIIGDQAFASIGSVIMANVKSNDRVIGNPARIFNMKGK